MPGSRIDNFSVTTDQASRLDLFARAAAQRPTARRTRDAPREDVDFRCGSLRLKDKVEAKGRTIPVASDADPSTLLGDAQPFSMARTPCPPDKLNRMLDSS